ncbi:hypothetical protein BD626DRAFT_628526 [Schizophyllum amplum]|uniref:Uncharacterized protein n=1 Tax=Schizophyllum amplum TaxID=97359 RepID=A0A550CKI5_9AGAR|nr:hypothetical protein BD626DRAFT_628526 [Auriculariopsis ampla]
MADYLLSSSPCPELDTVFDSLSQASDWLRSLLDSVVSDPLSALDVVNDIILHLDTCKDTVNRLRDPESIHGNGGMDEVSDIFSKMSLNMPSSIPMSPGRIAREEQLRQYVDAVPLPNLDDDDDGVLDPVGIAPAHALRSDDDVPYEDSDDDNDSEEEACVAAELDLDFTSEDSSTSSPNAVVPDGHLGRNARPGVSSQKLGDANGYGDYEDKCLSDVELSRAINRAGIHDSSVYILPENADSPANLDPTTAAALDHTPLPSLTPFDPVAALLRLVAEDRQQKGGAPVTIMDAATLTTPSPAPFVKGFTPKKSRPAREAELKLPASARLDTLVPCENLGDIMEEIAFTNILSRARGAVGKTGLTRDRLIQRAFEGILEMDDWKLNDDDLHTLKSALHALDDVLQSSREADIEYHYRRVHGEILKICLKRADPDSKHYMRSGSSSSHDNNNVRIPGNPQITPDLEDVYGQDNQIKCATEIKTKLSLLNDFMLRLLRLRVKLDDLQDLEALEEQLLRCPGFAHKFFWPPEGISMRAEDTMIVQVYTAMYYKRLMVYELSSSDRSVFFFKPSLDSTTLYVSRVYNTVDSAIDNGSETVDAVDCKANLTRFAMRYIAGHEELYEELLGSVPEPQKKHWAASLYPGPLFGVDTSTNWTHGKSFYVDDAPEDPLVMRRSARIESLRKLKEAEELNRMLDGQQHA